MIAQDNTARTQFHPEKNQELCLKAHRELSEVVALEAIEGQLRAICRH